MRKIKIDTDTTQYVCVYQRLGSNMCVCVCVCVCVYFLEFSFLQTVKYICHSIYLS